MYDSALISFFFKAESPNAYKHLVNGGGALVFNAIQITKKTQNANPEVHYNLFCNSLKMVLDGLGARETLQNSMRIYTDQLGFHLTSPNTKTKSNQFTHSKQRINE